FEVEHYVLRAVAMLKPQDVLEPHLRAVEREHELSRLEAEDTAVAEQLRKLQATPAEPGRDPGPLLAVLGEGGNKRKAIRARRQQLQQECESGRGEKLMRAQTLIQLRAETTEPEERRDLDERIADALPGVVSGVWVQAQHINRVRAVYHVQVWL